MPDNKITSSNDEKKILGMSVTTAAIIFSVAAFSVLAYGAYKMGLKSVV